MVNRYIDYLENQFKSEDRRNDQKSNNAGFRNVVNMLDDLDQD